MFNECFSAIFDAVSRRRGLVVGLAAVVTVAAAIDLRSISLDDNIELITTLHPELWEARIDPNQFAQIVLNLVVNARESRMLSASTRFNHLPTTVRGLSVRRPATEDSREFASAKLISRLSIEPTVSSGSSRSRKSFTFR